MNLAMLERATALADSLRYNASFRASLKKSNARLHVVTGISRNTDELSDRHNKIAIDAVLDALDHDDNAIKAQLATLGVTVQ